MGRRCVVAAVSEPRQVIGARDRGRLPVGPLDRWSVGRPGRFGVVRPSVTPDLSRSGWPHRSPGVIGSSATLPLPGAIGRAGGASDRGDRFDCRAQVLDPCGMVAQDTIDTPLQCFGSAADDPAIDQGV